jgi:gluconolactonase
LLTACSRPQATTSQEAASSKQETPPSVGTIERLDPALDALVPATAKIEKVATGFKFTEGPLWRPKEGVLWFSDVVGNTVYQLSPEGKVTVIMPLGGTDNPGYAPAGSFIGPNGMVAGKDGVVLLCQHGYRRIAQIGPDHKTTPFVSSWNGKKFNSPNDLVYSSDGALYFTDPPYGLVKQDDDPTKEIKFNGVFRFAKGKVEPVIRDLSRPNGIAFSPNGKYLYISNSDEKKRIWMRYEMQPNGSVKNGKVFFEIPPDAEKGLPDGVKVDSLGNLYCAGPNGIWIFSPDGKHLGTIKPGETPANFNWGDSDHKTLYITATTSVYRIKVAVEGEKALYQ